MMSDARALIVIVLVIIGSSALIGAEPATRPARVDPYAFQRDYKIAPYLAAAVKLQAMDAEARVARLKAMAADPLRASELFPLCRMLFDAKPKGEFRRPELGGPDFVGGGEIADWPLEPITLHHGVPILVAMNYKLGGYAERPNSYLASCLADCRWRDVKYAVMTGPEIRKVVEEFIASNPKFAGQAAWLRAQAE